MCELRAADVSDQTQSRRPESRDTSDRYLFASNPVSEAERVVDARGELYPLAQPSGRARCFHLPPRGLTRQLVIKRRPYAGATSARQQQQALEELSRADPLPGMSVVDTAIWEFQRIMMDQGVVLIDLPEDRGRVVDRTVSCRAIW